MCGEDRSGAAHRCQASLRCGSLTVAASGCPREIPLRSAARSSIDRMARRSAQMLVQVGERPLPRELGRGGIVTRRRVVVEPVLRPRVEIALVTNVGGLERGLVRGPACIDAL